MNLACWVEMFYIIIYVHLRCFVWEEVAKISTTKSGTRSSHNHINQRFNTQN